MQKACSSVSQKKPLQISVARSVEAEIGKKHLWKVITVSLLVYWLSFLGSISKINCLSNGSYHTKKHPSCPEVFLLQQTTVFLEPLTHQSSLQATGNVATWPERGDEDCQGDKPWFGRSAGIWFALLHNTGQRNSLSSFYTRPRVTAYLTQRTSLHWERLDIKSLLRLPSLLESAVHLLNIPMFPF